MAVDQAIAGLDSLELAAAEPTSSRLARLGARAWAVTWPKLIAIAIVLAAWELFYLSDFHHDSTNGLVKTPAFVLSDLWHQLHTQLLWSAIGATVRHAAFGYGLALVIGVAVGAVVSRVPPLRAGVGSIITALQTMPSIAWVPFAIILFGGTTSAILFVVVLGAAPSIANGLISGVDYTPPLLLRAGKVMGLRRLALYRSLILPASLPAFVAGMKQGWAFAWRSLMAAELVVPIIGSVGVGRLLSTAQDLLDLSGAIVVMIVILVLGICVDMLFTQLDLAIRRRRGLIDAAAS
jgi:NitT/TauT family transport system permease protein